MAGLDGTITMKSGEYRPCVVFGAKGLFHRWCKKEQLIVKLNSVLKNDKLDEVRRVYNETHFLPPGTTTEKIISTFGIVEFEDGMVKEVEVMNIRFLDSGNLFYENSLFFKEV